ncbi:hypothetical protein JCM1393_28490 [Clostridium carnis]
MKKLYFIFSTSLLFIIILSLSLIKAKPISAISEISSKIQKEILIEDFTEENIQIKEINLNELVDPALISMINNKSSERGIYGFTIQNEGKDYLYFNGINNPFINHKFDINDNKLIINCDASKDSNENFSKKLFLIEKKDNSLISNIQITVNELEDNTSTIYEF